MPRNNHKFAVKIRIFMRNPKTTFVIGIILIVCGLLESMETFIEDFISFNVKGYHGVVIFGIAQILMSFAHIADGLTDITLSEVEEEVDELLE